MENISARNMWGNFLDTQLKSASAETPKVIQFYDHEMDADQHADMAVQHLKKATSYPLLGLQCRKEPLPKIGSFLVIIDGRGHAKCIARITSMVLKPFFSIKESYIQQEGFNDLKQWKAVHWEYFKRELATYGREPKDSMIVVCITFDKVFDDRSQL
ncbi:MAG TPA: ASCH domain-containing protein [Arenibacter sp.]|nr:ASCH domain-containing protein [Arenibacter sp.]